MPLEGLRAWIGEVERKLGMRTRVFLVLAAIAIGGAGAAIYLALDTREDAVSESDVRALQDDLEAQIAGGGTGTGVDLSQLEADLRALEARVERMRDAAEPDQAQEGAAGSGDSGGGEGTAGTGGATPTPGIATEGTNGSEEASKARLRKLLEEAKRENDAAEAEQAEQPKQTGKSDDDG